MIGCGDCGDGCARQGDRVSVWVGGEESFSRVKVMVACIESG